jgi:hypothetical protein
MAKVITFSRQFPKGHPRAGQPTYFVEQVLNVISTKENVMSAKRLIELNWQNLESGKITERQLEYFWNESLNRSIKTEKPHTIRSGNRWKAGDKASLRVWSGTPYNSPQIIFAPEVELKEVINFKTQEDQYIFWLNGKENPNEFLTEIAKNDGLNTFDLVNWFRFPSDFEGQILCWKEVHYG